MRAPRRLAAPRLRLQRRERQLGATLLRPRLPEPAKRSWSPTRRVASRPRIYGEDQAYGAKRDAVNIQRVAQVLGVAASKPLDDARLLSSSFCIVLPGPTHGSLPLLPRVCPFSQGNLMSRPSACLLALLTCEATLEDSCQATARYRKAPLPHDITLDFFGARVAIICQFATRTAGRPPEFMACKSACRSFGPMRSNW